MTSLKRFAPPPLRLLMTEGIRATGDMARLAAAYPRLSRHMPAGDGHSVMVIPGFLAGNGSTLVLRGLLRRLEYDVHGWTFGRNWGLNPRVADGMSQHLQALAEASGGSVSLIGHSLGGLFARELAKQHPRLVRQVITLGSPFAGHPRSTNAWRLYQWATGEDIDRTARENNTSSPPPVPVSAIFSRSDGVVAWRCAVERADMRRENIEVRCSHVGMGHHPAVISAIADRLAQSQDHWAAFSPGEWNAHYFPTASSTVAGDAEGALA